MKTQNTLNEIAEFLKQEGRLKSAQLYIGTQFYVTIPYPQNKTLVFKDKTAADEFINQLNINKL
jgi:hypothetical protein